MNIAVSVKKARLFGIAGSALSIFLLLVPNIGGILNLIGAVLILIAVWSFSSQLKMHKIFFFFFIHVLVLIGTTVLAAATGNYLLSAFETGDVSILARTIQFVLAILPMVSAYFFFLSYRLLGNNVDVKLFNITATVQLIFASISTLLNLVLIFSSNRLAVSLGLLLTFAGYLVIPALGAISYALIRTSLVQYRSRT